jgi:2-polyprenyl-3-methyl-5-hydroxy-6-metoxy-1,4-benzoquinol methylase
VYDLDWNDFSPKYVTIIKKILEKQGIAKAKILDLACGTGILALILAENGHHVAGIDISPQMIEVARNKSSRLPDTAFQVQDMTKFQVDGTYDLITCIFDSINYVPDPAALFSMFNHVNAALKFSGSFLFDSNTHREYKKYHESSLARVLGKERFTQTFTYEKNKREAITTFVFRDGAVEVHRQRPYGLSELRPLLKRAGFKIGHVYSFSEKRKYEISQGRLICLAQKKSRGNRRRTPRAES